MAAASRSFKPASYLTSAAHGHGHGHGHTHNQPSHNTTRRPSYVRTSSSSSTHSNNSDDSFLATLRTLAITDKKDGDLTLSSSFTSTASGGVSPPCRTPVSSSCGRLFFEDTPGRKRSQPIAIEIPTRDRGAYTPLSARGDLPGGYFPNHESIQVQYKSHPFSNLRQDYEPPDLRMLNTPSNSATPNENTVKAPNLAFSNPADVAAAVPETLTMPVGKYHPSNYKLVSPSLEPTPSSVPVPPTSLEMPHTKTKPSNHAQRPSDAKRKLQQYQRDMIAQARQASSARTEPARPKPESPKLLPLGSPGPITPFELEESAGYIIAGARSGGGGGVDQERERELVARMIREEERRIGSRSGGGSPVLT